MDTAASRRSREHSVTSDITMGTCWESRSGSLASRVSSRLSGPPESLSLGASASRVPSELASHVSSLPCHVSDLDGEISDVGEGHGEGHRQVVEVTVEREAGETERLHAMLASVQRQLELWEQRQNQLLASGDHDDVTEHDLVSQEELTEDAGKRTRKLGVAGIPLDSQSPLHLANGAGTNRLYGSRDTSASHPKQYTQTSVPGRLQRAENANSPTQDTASSNVRTQRRRRRSNSLGEEFIHRYHTLAMGEEDLRQVQNRLYQQLAHRPELDADVGRRKSPCRSGDCTPHPGHGQECRRGQSVSQASVSPPQVSHSSFPGRSRPRRQQSFELRRQVLDNNFLLHRNGSPRRSTRHRDDVSQEGGVSGVGGDHFEGGAEGGISYNDRSQDSHRFDSSETQMALNEYREQVALRENIAEIHQKLLTIQQIFDTDMEVERERSGSDSS